MFGITEHESPDLDAIADNLANAKWRHQQGRCGQECPLCRELIAEQGEVETTERDGEFPF